MIYTRLQFFGQNEPNMCSCLQGLTKFEGPDGLLGWPHSGQSGCTGQVDLETSEGIMPFAVCDWGVSKASGPTVTASSVRASASV